MNWIIAGLIMFFSSVVLYLLVRKSVSLKVPSQFANLAMFAVPIIPYVLLATATHANLAVTPYQILVIAVLSIFFSYLGNALSLISIGYAPNPGYSLVISKSYVVFTTIAALFLFHAELTVRSTLAIVIIVICSALISIDRKGAGQQSHVRASWLPLALGAFFCWGMLTLTVKYLSNIGVGTFSRLIYSMIMVSFLIGVEIWWRHMEWKRLSRAQWTNLMLMGLLSTTFNYGLQQGLATAPNVGYINAMNAGSISLVAVGAAILFHDDFHLRKFIGVIGVTAGLILLVI